MNRKVILEKITSTSASVKLVCGVANNAAWLIMAEAMTHLKQSPRYRHKVKQAFKLASLEIHRYETNLVTASKNRMFHVADMTDNIRRRYGDITDRQYYEFWKSIGGPAYTKTHPLVTSLQNKYRLSMQSHGIKDADLVAWIMTAQAALDLSVKMYEKVINEAANHHGINRLVLKSIFDQFSLKPVSERWMAAMATLEPLSNAIHLDALEQHNIAHGVAQLCEAWVDPHLLYGSTTETIADSEEVFATKGFHRKALQEIAEVENETFDELEYEL